MKFSSTISLALPALTLAFPFMGSKEDMLRNAMKSNTVKRETTGPNNTGGTIANTAEIVNGLLGSVASSVDPENARPHPSYEFIAPGPDDSRGPCPGLNLLANYGYLPRNGYVSFGEVVNATAVGFNMGTDLATILATFGVLTDGDILTESWWLGTDPTKSGGLNKHSTIEVDISPNKEDFYTGCGDNHHISSRMFKQNVGIVGNSDSKQFDIPAMAQQYKLNSEFSQKYNPYLYYFPFPSIVSVVAFNFYPAYFSNGTYGQGGVANYESISSIVGAKYNADKDEFEYVPERWPENWYRRSYEYGAVQALTEGFTQIYPANPVPMPFSQLDTDNLNIQTILCDAYQGIQSIVPLLLSGLLADVTGTVSWAASKLDAVSPGTIAGCPKNALSRTAYLNNKGGPFSPPPSVLENTGNNVYNKIYFPSAPTTPTCNHSEDP